MISNSDPIATERELEDALPILCELGWHRPNVLPRWNNGFYFTRCARCGQDLVRTAFGKWQVPHGYRVVWQAQAPKDASTAALATAAQHDGPAVDEAPLPTETGHDLEQRIVQEVLRQLRNDDDAEPKAAIAEPEPVEITPDDAVPEPAAPDVANGDDEQQQARLALRNAARRSSVPDFMDDQNPYRWEPPASSSYRTFGPAYDPDDAMPGGHDAVEAAAGNPFQMLLGWRPHTRSREPSPRRPRRLASSRVRLAAFAVLPILMVLVLVQVLVGPRGAALGERSADVPPASLAPYPSEDRRAFVTARTLNCRSAPATQASSVSILRRGMPVQIIARDRDWASLSHEGGQCWAVERYLSAQQPI